MRVVCKKKKTLSEVQSHGGHGRPFGTVLSHVQVLRGRAWCVNSVIVTCAEADSPADIAAADCCTAAAANDAFMDPYAADGL